MKRLFLIAMLSLSLAIQAQSEEKVWAMSVAENTFLPLNKVAFTMTSDAEETFSVVASDGNVYKNIAKSTFEQVDATAINNAIATPAEPQIAIEVDGRISLSGVKVGSMISIHSLDGKQMMALPVASDEATIDVGTLVRGVYVLKTSGVSVKFIKR